MQRTLRARVVGAVSAVALVAGLTVALTAGSAGAASPSDPRADFHSGNVVNCGQIGLPDDTLAFANGTGSIDDGNVSGVVVNGTTVNVDDPAPGVVIHAVVVKGGPAYNVYSTNSGTPPGNHVPPAEDLPTEYISPLNGGGNVPTVSHWFICYGGEVPPPETGSLAVTKVVIPVPAGQTPVETIPTSFAIHVECSDGTTADLVLPVDEEGVPNFTGVVSDIEDGATCTVEETTPMPTGGVTTYSPINVTTDGVEVIGGEQTAVTVTNDFSGVSVEPANVVNPPAAAPAAAIAAAPTFTG
jgi:hypothetical protein